MSYNILTIIKIRQSTNKINVVKMLNAYMYWTLPIIYSTYPIISAFRFDFDFGLLSIYLRIPPIGLILILLVSWTIYVPVYNSKINQLKNLELNNYIYNDQNFNKILMSKNFFKKGIVNYSIKQDKRIDEATNNEMLFKIIADNQGWYIRKDKFSWMWLQNKNKTHLLYKQVLDNVCYLSKKKMLL
ncbi:MAG: hypothetical protein RSE26_01190 [Malacoplasma sp.]